MRLGPERMPLTTFAAILIATAVTFSAAPVTSAARADPNPVPRSVAFGDIRTHVLDYSPTNAGAPVLLLHGAFGSTRLWEGVAAELAACRRVIVPDMRGRGLTPLGRKDLSPAQLAADTFAMLDALAVRHAHAVGHSAGSIALIEMLRRRPGRVLSATLVGSPAMVIGAATGPTADLSADLRRLAAGQDALDPTLIQFREQWQRQAPEPQRFRELAAKLAARQRFEVDPANVAGRRPVMVVRAGHDALIAPEAFDRLAARIHANRIVDYPDGTHQLPRQHAQRLAADIAAFIAMTGDSGCTPVAAAP